MNKTLLYICCGILLPMSLFAKGHTLSLLSSNKSSYVIIIPQNATDIELSAATEFQRLFELSTKVVLPIYDDSFKKSSKEIRIGNVTRKQTKVDVGMLKEDGFMIKTEDQSLRIVAGSDKGALYGVYTFFDKYLGYRYYCSKVFKYPSFDELIIDEIENDIQVPSNVLRDTWYKDSWNPSYAKWHKLDHNTIGFNDEMGNWTHTLGLLVPAANYLKSHPEYYALVNGKRNPIQLCLTNPDVLKVVIDTMKQMIAANPKPLYWSISQNDNQRYEYCTCEHCAALDSVEQSHSGSMITFVNKVAEQFPDKMITTLAYQYTLKAPKTVIPHSNVVVWLCNIESERQTPLINNPLDTFSKDIEAWGKITKNIFIWDYVVQFTNYVSPFPNLRVLQPNMQLYVKNNAREHFQQGCGTTVGGEFSELRQYLIARLLWNTDVDIKAEMSDFLNGYYEQAAPYISQYIELMHDELEASNLVLRIYGSPCDHAETGYLRADLMARYEAMFDRAESAVAHKIEVLERVKSARLPLTYALFQIARSKGVSESRVFEQVDGKWQVKPGIMKKLDDFNALCNKVNITHMCEWHTSPNEYCAQLREFFANINK